MEPRFFQKDIETMKRADIEALQLRRLKWMVDYCYNNVPFYHERLGQVGITSGDKIKTLSDIQYIPFTTKDDIRDNYPFGMLAVPMKDIVRIHASSGTTGKPTVGAYTKEDIENWSDFVARIVTASGVTSDDIIQISFGYGLFTGALGLHFGLEKVGATVIPASSGNSEKQLMMLRDFGVTGLVATPSYALYLGELVRESPYPKEAYASLKYGILGSEGCTEEMRQRIEENLGVTVTDNYGMTELTGPGVSGECHLRCGLHFAEDAFLPEIIDQDTLEQKPAGEVGATVIPASSGNSEKQLMMLRDFGVTGLVATPSYALYLGELVRESPYPKEAYASLKYGILGSEGCTEEMRQRIEENLGVTVTDNYGMTELTGPGVSGECHLRCGLHFAEDAFLPEIIDQDTLEQKPAGEVGELVVTTLTRKGMPVLRYRTKDITRLHYEPCACGRTHVRMDKVMGRTDDMLIIKGVNVFPSQIESVLVGMENVGPHYQLVVRKRNYLDTLEVKVELVDASLLESFGELQALQKKIHDRLKSVLGLETKVTLVSPKSLERFQGKAKRVLDLRNQPETE